ncbi:Small ribosomal subunit protein eS24 [Caenorhabditis elegans]|uniref:Small ribosomal subunit protein eS24 n=1 Tax=Caenorhabditis elegans TaxID=6239 RepID=YN23_CAEEL|nr:Small ribosomal subunit protein eS24 [Caenorhabditis elegans]P34582.2 RecName: Full=Small ribosomal subunit protein eS24; AltName: Full=Uncharacterized protein T26G10.3 [Caenorhabditis elegans]CAA82363.2 Small ribosomal subunit protein eS24 [Caenorhabditis elegans]
MVAEVILPGRPTTLKADIREKIANFYNINPDTMAKNTPLSQDDKVAKTVEQRRKDAAAHKEAYNAMPEAERRHLNSEKYANRKAEVSYKHR